MLAYVFKKFRNNSLKNYGLCPSYYLSPAALSWNAMLNMAKVELELVSDGDMYLFFGKGYSKNSKASNKCLKSYDPPK